MSYISTHIHKKVLLVGIIGVILGMMYVVFRISASEPEAAKITFSTIDALCPLDTPELERTSQTQVENEEDIYFVSCGGFF